MPIVTTVYHGTECISYVRLNVWDILPQKLRNIKNLENLKTEIKTWKPNNYPCRLRKVYIEDAVFL